MSRDGIARLGAFMCWSVVAVLAVRLGFGLAEQERRLAEQAAEAVQDADAVEAAWSRWDGSSPPDALLSRQLPLNPRAGISLARYVLGNRTGASGMAWTRISSLPFLVDSWYRGVPVSRLLDGEIVLLAWMWLPIRFGDDAGLPLSVGTGVAIDAGLEAEVRRRCPAGCPPLSSGDVDRVRRQLVALLDQPEGKLDLTALNLILRGGSAAVPVLRNRVDSGSSRPGQSLAFLALVRLLPSEQRRALIAETLDTGPPGLRLLAVLEAARQRDVSLLPLVEARATDAEPPGAGVVALVAADLLRRVEPVPE